jgi:hypothetical protein
MTDLGVDGRVVFSKEIDALIREIIELGGYQEVEPIVLAWHMKEPSKELETQLLELKRQLKERGQSR